MMLIISISDIANKASGEQDAPQVFCVDELVGTVDWAPRNE